MSIYLDYAGSTPVAPEVAAAMTAVLADADLAGNPSAVTHDYGRRAAALIDSARATVAGFVGADPEAVIFTSGATESDNLAILGTARFLATRGRHVVTALTEHRAVREPCRRLEAAGWNVTWLRPGDDGLIAPSAVAAALRRDTVLVSLMHVNNETGAITDVAAIGHLCRDRGVLLHVDAAQSAAFLPIDMRAFGIDLLSLSAHKLYGPKGSGALCIDRQRLGRLEPLLVGGGQERGLRPGTLATHQVVGLAAACALAAGRRAEDRAHVQSLQRQLWARLGACPGILRNGSAGADCGHILNVSVAGVEGESLRAELPGLAVASGAACTSRDDEPSPVLRAFGRSPVLARSALRFSFGRATTPAEVDAAADAVLAAIAALRRDGPDIPLPAAPRGTVLMRGEAGAEEAGARVVFGAVIRAGRIERLNYRVFGCPATRAACVRAAVLLTGAPVAALGEVQLPALKAGDAPAGRLLIIQDALRNCLADWENGGLKSAP